MRKIVGLVALLVLVAVYALLAIAVASARLAEAPAWLHLLYFLATGLLWLLPAMWIIRWMIGPPRGN
jgi:hypothetical protein